MKAFDTIIPSTLCSSMTHSSHWFFRMSSQPVVKDIIKGLFQLIQLRNLGRVYIGSSGAARKLGLGKQCLVYYPSVGVGLINMLEG